MNYVLCQNGIPAGLLDRIMPDLRSGKMIEYRFPEIEASPSGSVALQPNEQVEKIRKLVLRHAESGEQFVMLTASPFVLKAVDVYSDLLECQEEYEFVNAEGETVEIQTLFEPMSETFGKLTYGEHWQAKP